MPGRPADWDNHVQNHRTQDPRVQNLTVRDIDKLTPKAAQYVVWDDDVTGFGVRVGAKAKTFVFKYRLPSGRVRWATIGRVGRVTLDQARRRGRSMAGIAAEGKDPQEAKDAAKGAILTRDVIEQWLEEHVDVHFKPATARNYRSPY